MTKTHGRRRPTPALHPAARAPKNPQATDVPHVDPAPRRHAAGAQTEAPGVAAPEAPKAPHPVQSTEPVDDGTTARRTLVVAILRTLPLEQLAPVVAALVSWLSALHLVACYLRKHPGESSRVAVDGIAYAAARALLDPDDGPSAAQHQVSALSGVWLFANPYAFAEVLSADNIESLATALADLEHARELLCVDAPPRCVRGPRGGCRAWCAGGPCAAAPPLRPSSAGASCICA